MTRLYLAAAASFCLCYIVWTFDHSEGAEWKNQVAISAEVRGGSREVSLTITNESEVFTFLLKRSERRYTMWPVLIGDGNTITSEGRDKETSVPYQGRNGSFLLNLTNTAVVFCKGFFHKGKHSFLIEPDGPLSNHTLKRLGVRQNLQQEHIRPSDNGNTDYIFLHLPAGIPTLSRSKRQLQLYVIEFLIVVDFHLYEQFRKRASPAENVRSHIEEEMAAIVNGVDARFKGVRGMGYVIDVVIAAIYIATDTSSSPWSIPQQIQSTVDETGKQNVLTEKSLKKFQSWANSNLHELPEFDHAMAFTGYDLYKEGKMSFDNFKRLNDQKTLGLGFKQSLCTDRRYSIVEHHGNMAYTSYIATHELAHSLGAKHDGFPAEVEYRGIRKSCSADDGYVMAPKAPSDPGNNWKIWQISDCTVLYFDFFIDHLNENKTNCMKTQRSWQGSSGTQQTEVSQYGVYTPDEQCERANGVGSVLDRTRFFNNPSHVCNFLTCTDPLSSDEIRPTLPLEGIVCGANKLCQLGHCIDVNGTKEENVSIEDSCIHGDQPGKIGNTGLTCAELFGSLDAAHKCYLYETQCCETCRYRQRHNQDINECEYGDRKPDCTLTECNTSLCCETCARADGKFSDCKPFPRSAVNMSVIINTPTPFYGTVATFSCMKGSQLVGSKTSSCLKDGSWSHGLPHCVPGCKPFKLTSYLQITEDNTEGIFSTGTSVTVRCSDGLVLEGNKTLTCQRDGDWSNDVPVCKLDFPSSATVSVQENTAPGAVIHRLDTGYIDSQYKILYFTESGLEVTKEGKVIIKEGQIVDYEECQVYTLIVEATSLYYPGLTAKQRLDVMVEDVNEYNPVFEQNSYCTTLQKSTRPGTILKVTAHDQDTLDKGIEYFMNESNVIRDLDADEVFQIDKATGTISLEDASEINRLNKTEFIFSIFATDSGSPRRSSSVLVSIKVDIHCYEIDWNYNNGHICATSKMIFMYVVFVYMSDLLIGLNRD